MIMEWDWEEWISTQHQISSRPGDAALYGKGWSLDDHDFSLDPILRVAVNEAALVVPGCVGTMWDERPLLALYRARYRIRVEHLLLPSYYRDAIGWYGVLRSWGDGSIGYYEEEGGIESRCTASRAIENLSLCGVKRIFMVGFDLYFQSGGGRAPSDRISGSPYSAKVVSEVTEGVPEALHQGMVSRTDDYDDVNKAISLSAASCEVELVDAGRSKV